MKKTIAILLSVLLVVGLLAGCGGGSSSSSTGSADSGKTLTFYADAYADNTEIHVIYKRNIAAAGVGHDCDTVALVHFRQEIL